MPALINVAGICPVVDHHVNLFDIADSDLSCLRFVENSDNYSFFFQRNEILQFKGNSINRSAKSRYQYFKKHSTGSLVMVSYCFNLIALCILFFILFFVITP